MQLKKRAAFVSRYGPDEVVQQYLKENEGFNYRDYDYLKVFRGSHPAAMKEFIAAQDWQFDYDPSRNDMSPKEKIMRLLERLTGRQFFIYKNYKILKK